VYKRQHIVWFDYENQKKAIIPDDLKEEILKSMER